MKIRDDEEQESVGPNLTPMIDIVFLLIIFFMVSTTFIELEKDLEIDLPEASAGEVSTEASRVIVVNVRKGGEILVNGEEASAGALRYKLQRAVEENPKQAVEIRADREAQHGAVVSVIDAVKLAKVTNLSLKAFEAK